MLEAIATVGHRQINLGGQVSDPTPQMTNGFLLIGEDPYWGYGEFVYAQASAAINSMALCAIVPAWDATNGRYTYYAAPVPNTANLGQEVGVSIQPLASGNWGYFKISGICPILSTASVAANTALGLTGAGAVGAVSAGKQILNARVINPATFTVTKPNTTGYSGSTIVKPNTASGLFVGVYVSGTGIASGAYVTGIDNAGVVTLSAPNTGNVTGTMTATYNNGTTFYNVVKLNRSFVQGQIT